MYRSRTVGFIRLCTSVAFSSRSVQLRSFTLSCPKGEGQQPLLQAKSDAVQGDIGGEQWFPELGRSPLSRFFVSKEGEELVDKPQSEGDGPVWRAMRTISPRQQAAIKDVSGLFREDGSVTIDPFYLRDSCQCRLCVDSSTLQRRFVTAHIPLDIEAVFDGRSNQGRVKFKWKNDIPGYPADHQSVYTQSEIRTLTLPSPDSVVARKRHYWDREAFEKRANWTTYADFVNDTEAYKVAMSALHRDGLIFITKVDANEEAVRRMAERIGPLRNTFYGSTWDVRSVGNPKNVAYTNRHLGFHMDLLYMSNPPGYQLLHCLKNSCSGGESRFADAFLAATRLRQDNESHYRKLTRYPVEWTYENDGQFYIARRPTFHEVQSFIGTEEQARRRLERKANKNDDADLAYVNWSPPFQGRLYHNHEHPERTKEFIQATKTFDRILNDDAMVYELKMEEGTCAIFENRRVVHARNAFQMGDGERWLRGAYVDEDAFWSKCRAIGADKYDTSSIPHPDEVFVRRYEASGKYEMPDISRKDNKEQSADNSKAVPHAEPGGPKKPNEPHTKEDAARTPKSQKKFVLALSLRTSQRPKKTKSKKNSRRATKK
ncbi:hypothetical protein GJ744_006051 [Endocarpon pusillum]|uniref:TauD/TfdA-like domain-containing protein n=1 Tax=Endocarpon pusillum TaxID=364733 RepID=A0A8H7E6Y0_9EURO|nr:hypothetical protein GJ744_006051 [Endocarpon pusillum]